ncbi:Holliday junction branch migration protein RuvA [Candidatus Babeliales bacterium]|nr:Holliday junction branch migration protein RuvA [Candidatus Babeliales bacterium]MCF7899624.1 Holliday junction branch migration protein RuvA [Candidatus Babeliales bacterium]
MIDFIAGKIKKIEEKNVTILVNGIGFSIQMSQTKNLSLNQEAEIFLYMHWNQEKGPALYGFLDDLEKTVFLMIIDCPKIGPGIASNILSQISAGEFLEIVSSQNEKALSKINGIGEKKAEQIIVQLKHKVSKLISSGKVQTQVLQQDFTMWQNVNDVLVSLNYSKPEISKAMQYLTAKYSGQNAPLDQLIRSALGYLSGNL